MIPQSWRAIAATRLLAERRTIAYAFAAAVVVAFVQPSGLAAPLFFCGLLGVVVALTQGPGRHRHLDLCEESAPLYGRELARAKSLAPCAVAVLVSFAYWGAQWLRGISRVAALVRARAGRRHRVHDGRAFGDDSHGVVAAALPRAGMRHARPSLLRSRSTRVRPSREVLFCALVALVALRQYGESLARYDPV